MQSRSHRISLTLALLVLPLLVSARASAPPAIAGFGPEVRFFTRITADDMLDEAPRIPRDVYRLSGRHGALHRDLAKFAWLEFIALNSPVGSSQA
jgi:hypothetical protein